MARGREEKREGNCSFIYVKYMKKCYLRKIKKERIRAHVKLGGHYLLSQQVSNRLELDPILYVRTKGEIGKHF